eukprot:6011381-Amphidinium_carterae.2
MRTNCEGNSWQVGHHERNYHFRLRFVMQLGPNKEPKLYEQPEQQYPMTPLLGRFTRSMRAGTIVGRDINHTIT